MDRLPSCRRCGLPRQQFGHDPEGAVARDSVFVRFSRLGQGEVGGVGQIAAGQGHRAGIGGGGLVQPTGDRIEVADLQREIGIVGHEVACGEIMPLGARQLARFLEHVAGLDVTSCVARAQAERLLIEHRRRQMMA